MKTIIFRNEKGEFAKSNVNYGFELNYDFFTAVCKRVGQMPANVNNNVVVSLSIKKTAIPINFQATLFDTSLSATWSCGEKWQYKGADSDLVITYDFDSNTWANAFNEAKEYLFSEIEKYEKLVYEREKALIHADF